MKKAQNKFRVGAGNFFKSNTVLKIPFEHFWHPYLKQWYDKGLLIDENTIQKYCKDENKHIIDLKNKSKRIMKNLREYFEEFIKCVDDYLVKNVSNYEIPSLSELDEEEDDSNSNDNDSDKTNSDVDIDANVNKQDKPQLSPDSESENNSDI